MAALTEVSICNMALSELGELRISNLTDLSNKTVRTCNIWYEKTRDFVLSEHDWTCAIVWQTLSKLTETPHDQYAYYYQLPSSPKWLRIVSIEPVQIYEVEGDKLKTSGSTVHLRYVKQMVIAGEIDIMLATAIAMLLASNMCRDITGNTTERDRLLGQYEMTVRKAMARDAILGPIERRKGKQSWSTVGRI
jgi:hypothetical protein